MEGPEPDGSGPSPIPSRIGSDNIVGMGAACRKDLGKPDNRGQYTERPKQESRFDPPPAVPPLEEVLASAARLQTLVPDAVLVGGSAAAFHAKHRLSTDHDHVLTDLRDRFETVLEALEADPEFVLNRMSAGKIILGRLDGIEVGVRQLIRERPLEVEAHNLPNGSVIRVPTRDETLRIKAYMIVKRNQVRDYLDVAALSDALGVAHAAQVLAGADDYYTDPKKDGSPFSGQLVHQLGMPRPQDVSQTKSLDRYKGLVSKWHDWGKVVDQLRSVAAHMLGDNTCRDDERGDGV